VHFTPAKFDATTTVFEFAPSPSKSASDEQERQIVTSTGNFLVSWDYRKVKTDYGKLQKQADRVETSVAPMISDLAAPVLDTAMQYGDLSEPNRDAVVVAATEEMLARLSLH